MVNMDLHKYELKEKRLKEHKEKSKQHDIRVAKYESELGNVLDALSLVSIILAGLLLYLVSKHYLGKETAPLISGLAAITAAAYAVNAYHYPRIFQNIDASKMQAKSKFNRYIYTTICLLSGLYTGLWTYLYFQ